MVAKLTSDTLDAERESLSRYKNHSDQTQFHLGVEPHVSMLIMGVEFLLFYIIIFFGYIAGALLLIAAIYFFLKKPRQPAYYPIAYILLFIGLFAVTANYVYMRNQGSEYQSQQQRERDIAAYKQAASLIDFPVYSYQPNDSSDARVSAIVNSRHSLHVIYAIENGTYASSMYQYKTDKKPYTLYQLETGSCDNQPICKRVGESIFGPTYVVNYGDSFVESMYFASNGSTSIFIKFDNKISDTEAIAVLNDFKPIQPKDLPFTGKLP